MSVSSSGSFNASDSTSNNIPSSPHASVRTCGSVSTVDSAPAFPLPNVESISMIMAMRRLRSKSHHGHQRQFLLMRRRLSTSSMPGIKLRSASSSVHRPQTSLPSAHRPQTSTSTAVESPGFRAVTSFNLESPVFVQAPVASPSALPSPTFFWKESDASGTLSIPRLSSSSFPRLSSSSLPRLSNSVLASPAVRGFDLSARSQVSVDPVLTARSEEQASIVCTCPNCPYAVRRQSILPPSASSSSSTSDSSAYISFSSSSSASSSISVCMCPGCRLDKRLAYATLTDLQRMQLSPGTILGRSLAASPPVASPSAPATSAIFDGANASRASASFSSATSSSDAHRTIIGRRFSTTIETPSFTDSSTMTPDTSALMTARTAQSHSQLALIPEPAGPSSDSTAPLNLQHPGPLLAPSSYSASTPPSASLSQDQDQHQPQKTATSCSSVGDFDTTETRSLNSVHPTVCSTDLRLPFDLPSEQDDLDIQEQQEQHQSPQGPSNETFSFASAQNVNSHPKNASVASSAVSPSAVTPTQQPPRSASLAINLSSVPVSAASTSTALPSASCLR